MLALENANAKKLFLSCDFSSIWSDVERFSSGSKQGFLLFYNNSFTYSLTYSAFKPEEMYSGGVFYLPVEQLKLCCGGRKAGG
jgi:hypothetical protein